MVLLLDSEVSLPESSSTSSIIIRAIWPWELFNLLHPDLFTYKNKNYNIDVGTKWSNIC